MQKKFLLAPLLAIGFLFAGRASAATLDAFFIPSSAVVGTTVTLTVTVNTEGVGVNAAQATLQYPKDLLEVTQIDTGGSVFNFWLEGPSYSNETGRIFFTGGSTNGFNGSALSVVRVQVKILKEGVANISFVDGAVLASDGVGSNVLTTMHNATVTGTQAVVPEAPPTQIVRKPTLAELTPAKPKLEIPLYPDTTKWSNALAPFLVRWNLPSDVSGVATALNQVPKFVPQKSEGLFDNKTFRMTKDGVWYLHIRFRNNVGWGETAHVRLAVDTAPPTPFQIDVNPGLVTDMPTPTISFKSSDAAADIQGYVVRLDGVEVAQTTEGSYTFLPLLPGNHLANVAAVDQAGNSTTATIEITTLPITSPTISPITRDVYVGEGRLDVGGTADKAVTLLVQLQQSSGELVGEATVVPDMNGTWVARFDQPLKRGEYVIIVTAKDERGASSLPVTTGLSVKSRPFLIIGGVEISQTWFFFCVVILLLAGMTAGWLLQKQRKEKRGWHLLIARRDLSAAFDQIQKQLKYILDRYKKKNLGSSEIEEMLNIVKRLHDRNQEIREYILEHIEEINR